MPRLTLAAAVACTAPALTCGLMPCGLCVPVASRDPGRPLDGFRFKASVDGAVRAALGEVRWGILTFEVTDWNQTAAVGLVRVLAR